jgi:hypothetical protein
MSVLGRGHGRGHGRGRRLGRWRGREAAHIGITVLSCVFVRTETHVCARNGIMILRQNFERIFEVKLPLNLYALCAFYALYGYEGKYGTKKTRWGWSHHL